MERVETNAVSDVLVSRLYTYIAELGGKLNITVILPDHTQIELTGLLQENTAARQKRLLAMRNMAAG